LQKPIPMSSRIDQRRNYSRKQAIGVFYWVWYLFTSY
jgi:hypothetical protein